ncbi:hypothetical protein ACSF85_07775 [Moraxella bovoculi]
MRTIGLITTLPGVALLTACASNTPASQINETTFKSPALARLMKQA